MIATHLLAIIFANQSILISDSLPLNTNVNSGAINETICVRGWTKTIRPPVSYTGPIKHQMMKNAGVPLENEDGIKLDHKIPLALGGSPDSLENFVLQPNDEAKDKDRVEVCLARMVCANKLDLTTAQIAIWENWRTAGRLCAGYKVIE